MQNINSASELKAAILLLQSRQDEEVQMVRAQFHRTTESIKPINLIKSAFKQVTGLEETKGNIVSSSVGLTAGYFSKIIFERISHNPIKKLIGTALLFGINNIIAKNPEAVKSVGNFIFSAIRGKRSAGNPEIHNKESVAEI